MTSLLCSAVVFQPLITAATLLSILSAMPDAATARDHGAPVAEVATAASADREYTFSTDGVDRIVLDLHAADLVLSGTTAEEIGVSLTEVRVSDHCHIRVEPEGRNLVIESRVAPGPGAGRCRLEVAVSVPASLDVVADVGAGDVELLHLGADLALSAGVGDVTGSAHGQQLRVSTGAGDVDLHGLRAAVEAHTGTGDLWLRFAHAPTGTIDASSGVGDVVIHLPADALVEAAASTGLGDVRQAVASHRGAPTIVRASTGLGDVTVD